MRKLLEQPMAIAFEKNFPEVILGISTIAYGTFLVVPPDSFQYSEGYGVIASIMPSWVWGLVFALVGLANFWGVLRRRGDLVRSTAKVLAFMWFTAGFLFAWSAFFSPGWILMICIAILYAGVSSEYRTKTKWHDGTGELGPDL